MDFSSSWLFFQIAEKQLIYWCIERCQFRVILSVGISLFAVVLCEEFHTILFSSKIYENHANKGVFTSNWNISFLTSRPPSVWNRDWLVKAIFHLSEPLYVFCCTQYPLYIFFTWRPWKFTFLTFPDLWIASPSHFVSCSNIYKNMPAPNRMLFQMYKLVISLNSKMTAYNSVFLFSNAATLIVSPSDIPIK